jgi:2-oxoglutarate dehydrogenase E2 component (dihydrolipoamide succinyltransferase)
MPTEVLMPEIGETVISGTIVVWLKEVGDEIADDEPLVEVETDKANVEIPSPAAGILSEILAQEGDEVDVGGLLAIITAPGEKPAEAKAPPREEPAEKEAAPPPPSEEKPVESATAQEPARKKAAPQPEEPAKPKAKEPAIAKERAPEPAEITADQPPALEGVTSLSPMVKRMAKEHGISVEELRKISGGGAGGRVTKDDLLDHIARKERGEKPSESKAAAPPARKKAVSQAERSAEELEEIIPLEGMRKAIAEHMVRSKRTSPHVTTIAEADMSAVVAIRDKNKVAFKQAHGVSLTYLPFFISATVQALIEFPHVNSSLRDDNIILKRYYHIGISVQTERGLMTPVIRDADRLSIEGLAKALDSLAGRARDGRLNLKEIQGGTFSITSPGTYGAILSTPIINQPQAAILGVEKIQKRAVVIDDAISIRPMVYLCLSYDHRIVDGSSSIQFLQRVRQLIEAGDFPIELCS